MADKKKSGFLDKPRSFITDDRDKVKDTPHSIRDLGNAVEEGAKNLYRYTKDSIKSFPDTPDINNYRYDPNPTDSGSVEPSDPKNYGR